MMYRKGFIIFFLFKVTQIFSQTSEQEIPEWGSQFLEGKYSAVYSHFSPEMKAQIKRSEFISTIQSLQKSVGSFTSIRLQNVTDQLDVYELYTEKSYFELHVKESTDGISSFFIRPAAYAQPTKANGRSFYRKNLSIEVNDSQSLSAELLFPKTELRVPVVVLVHGSGASDMDETVGPNKIFKDIALSLAAEGVATLRYHKRSFAYPEWQMSDSLDLMRETIEDALGALKVLQADSSVDHNRIWVLGHSLGGYALPAILASDKGWAGGIIMGGNSRPVEELIPEQLKYLAMLDGKINRKEAMLIRRSEKVQKLVEERQWSELQKALTRLNHLYYWPVLFFKNNVYYDPAVLAQYENRPLLILHAKRDYQVDESNLLRWRQHLEQKPNVRFVAFEHLNHLFMYGSGDPNPMEYLKPGNVSEELIQTVIDNIHGQ